MKVKTSEMLDGYRDAVNSIHVIVWLSALVIKTETCIDTLQQITKPNCDANTCTYDS